jgi:hypothetical protein
VKSLSIEVFWQLYRKLPEDVRELARKNYQLFMTNPDHPGLNFKSCTVLVISGLCASVMTIGLWDNATVTPSPGYGSARTRNTTACFNSSAPAAGADKRRNPSLVQAPIR